MKLTGCVSVLFMVGMVLAQAQYKATKETKVILAVEDASKDISQVVLFNTFKEMKDNGFFKKPPNFRCYIGLLQGRYMIEDDRVIPGRGSTIIMYTDRQYPSGITMRLTNGLAIGDQMNLGPGTAKVVAHKKGELILEAQ